MRRMLIIALCAACCLAVVSLLFAAGKPAAGVHAVISLDQDLHIGYPKGYPSNLESGDLFGGSVDGKWIDGEAMMPRLKGGERYRVYASLSCLGTGTGDAPSPGQGEDDGGWSSPGVTMTLPRGATRAQAVIAIAGDWNALPRVPREQSVTQPVYRQVVQEYLAKKGQRRAKANITRLLRVDLEGDGQEEVLICAVTPGKNIVSSEEGQGEGDYSLVLLRKLVKGKVVILPVAEYFFDGNPGSENLYRLIGAFDVNGDGVMEIVVGYYYHEGFGSTIYEVKGSKITEVLGAGNGV